MALKFPPPPDLGRDNQRLNRWLLEIQNILNAGGFIEPGQVEGLVALFLQVDVNTAAISILISLTPQVAQNSIDIATLQGQVVTLQGQVAALIARNQIRNGIGAPGAGLGNDGDLYLNNTGGAGTRLYGKIGGVWVVVA